MLVLLPAEPTLEAIAAAGGEVRLHAEEHAVALLRRQRRHPAHD